MLVPPQETGCSCGLTWQDACAASRDRMLVRTYKAGCLCRLKRQDACVDLRGRIQDACAASRDRVLVRTYETGYRMLVRTVQFANLRERRETASHALGISL